MNRVLFLVFAILCMQVIAEEPEAPETIWLESDKMVSCVPRNLNLGESLQVKLGEHHGKELAVYRHEENLWLFLVVGSPPSEMTFLMSPFEFEGVNAIEITPETTGYRWDSKGGNEAIFSKPGKYTLYVSSNLESEDGWLIAFNLPPNCRANLPVVANPSDHSLQLTYHLNQNSTADSSPLTANISNWE
jgi:hypothetical protein